MTVASKVMLIDIRFFVVICFYQLDYDFTLQLRSTAMAAFTLLVTLLVLCTTKGMQVVKQTYSFSSIIPLERGCGPGWLAQLDMTVPEEVKYLLPNLPIPCVSHIVTDEISISTQ